MFISCNCSIDDFDENIIDEVSWPKARKEHTCEECGRTIEKGEKYEVCTLLTSSDGWSRYKTCLGCTRIREAFCPEGFYIGGLALQVSECIGFNYVTGEE